MPENRTRPEIPGGGNLALTQADRVTLQTFIDYRLAPNAVERQKETMTSNRSEAFHKRALKAVPKDLTFKRNYSGRVHAAALADSIGSGAAISRVNQYMGASHAEGSPGKAGLRALDKQEKYHQDRKKTWAYKNRRYHLRKAKMQPKDTAEGYQTDSRHPMVRREHSYSKK